MSQIALVEIIERKFIHDGRGSFLKVMHGKESGLPDSFGEIYTVVAKPREFRANHFHKIANEWFTLLSGRATLTLMDVVTGERKVVDLDASQPITVKVPPMVAHSFFNDNDNDFLLLAYSDYRYDPADTLPMNFD